MMNDISSKKAECMFGVNVEAAIFFEEVVVEEAAQQAWKKWWRKSSLSRFKNCSGRQWT
jgi:hypothetical protein